MGFKSLILSSLLLIGVACAHTAPTPLLIGGLVDLNNEVVTLYTSCSEAISYTPDKEGCDSDLLNTKTTSLIIDSLDFIKADIKQPQGYDIHLATSLIYFRIAERNLNEYTKAEQIARQFFEIQKAHSGRSIGSAKFYWAWFASSTASKQYFEDRISLTQERKANLLLALGEGTSLLNKLEGPRLVRLQQALTALQFVIDSI